MKPWAPSPPLHKPVVVVHTCNSSIWAGIEEGDQEFRVLVSYIVSSRPAWDAYYPDKKSGGGRKRED